MIERPDRETETALDEKHFRPGLGAATCFTLPLAVKRGKCRWLLSGFVVLVFADIERWRC